MERDLGQSKRRKLLEECKAEDPENPQFSQCVEKRVTAQRAADLRGFCAPDCAGVDLPSCRRFRNDYDLDVGEACREMLLKSEERTLEVGLDEGGRRRALPALRQTPRPAPVGERGFPTRPAAKRWRSHRFRRQDLRNEG